MKHLDEYNIFEGKEYIDKICRNYDIYNYTINDDGSIDVNGNVDLWGDKFTRLPLNFNRVSGYFDCHSNELISLEGCPKYVGKYFNCHSNELISLEGCPKYVGRSFTCGKNRLTSLEGGPKYVGGNFTCSNNKITSLEGYPEHIGGNFHCVLNPIFTIAQYFNTKENKNTLIELFNYYDIIQNMNVIYDRLKFFYEGIDVKITVRMLKDIESIGYKIIY